MSSPGFAWRQVFWPRPFNPDLATGLLRQWAADQRSPTIVLEAHASEHGIDYWLGADAAVLPGLAATISDLVPGALLVVTAKVPRPTPVTARRLSANTRHRALNADQAEPASRAVLSAFSRVRGNEQLVLQVVLGPRRVPLAIPTTSPSSIVAPWWEIAWRGNGQQVDSEKRGALRGKVELHGFATTVRLAVSAATPRRRQLLLLGLMAALRSRIDAEGFAGGEPGFGDSVFVQAAGACVCQRRHCRGRGRGGKGFAAVCAGAGRGGRDADGRG